MLSLNKGFERGKKT